MNGNFLKERLQYFDIQLVELSKKLEISPQTLQSRFKTKDVTLNFLLEICKAINKTPYLFLKGSVYEKLIYTEGSFQNEVEFVEKVSEPISKNISQDDILIELLQKQIAELRQDKEELKKDKEELKKDKALLTSLIETKLGNQEAS